MGDHHVLDVRLDGIHDYGIRHHRVVHDGHHGREGRGRHGRNVGGHHDGRRVPDGHHVNVDHDHHDHGIHDVDHQSVHLDDVGLRVNRHDFVGGALQCLASRAWCVRLVQCR